LDAGLGAVAQRFHELRADRITEAHVVNSDVERSRRGTDEGGEPRHDGVGCLFALGKKKEGQRRRRGQ
jgi:hypothetical protein